MVIVYTFSDYLPFGSYAASDIPFYFTDEVHQHLDINGSMVVAWLVPGYETTSQLTSTAKCEIQEKIREAIRTTPNLADEFWCKHNNNGFDYKSFSRYFIMNHSQRQALSLEQFDCSHCAWRKALEIQAIRGISNPRLYCTSASVLPLDYMPRSQFLEVVGETPCQTSATIKDGVMPDGLICSNCGQFAHTSRTCDRTPKSFYKIGVELEGRYLNLRRTQTVANALGADYGPDGSIGISDDSNACGYEFKTKPGTLRDAITQIIALYPDEADTTCGMHIHVSFSADVLTLLNTTAFFDYFGKRWAVWGQKMNLHPDSPFFKRLNGDNDYCRRNNYPEEDMLDMDRYHQLNFSAWSKCKTVECRLLPMFRRSSLAIAAVQELISIYEDFLACPEKFGFVWPVPANVALDKGYFVPSKANEKFEIELPGLLKATEQFTLELEELAPPASGMMRIALPVNKAITVEMLAERMKNWKAA